MNEQQECCDTPSHHITLKLRHRLASANPRIVEYSFSDRPDEIFTDRDLLMKHRGLTLEELRQTVIISPRPHNTTGDKPKGQAR